MKAQKRHLNAYLLWLSLTTELLLLVALKTPTNAAVPHTEQPPAATSQVLADAAQHSQSTDAVAVTPPPVEGSAIPSPTIATPHSLLPIPLPGTIPTSAFFLTP